MSEYWKSTPKYWCKHCKIFVRDTKLEKTNHEATPKHQGNLQRFLRELYKGNEREQRDKQRAKNEADRLNGITPGSGANAGGNPWERKPTTPAASTLRQATPADRKKQLAQLAEMGVAVPDEFRKEMAMAGDWQTTSQRLVYDNGKKEEHNEDVKPEAMNIGVRKRKFEGQEEEEEAGETVVRRGWGSTTRSYPESSGNGDDDLDALLKATKTIKTTPHAASNITEQSDPVSQAGLGLQSENHEIKPPRIKREASSNDENNTAPISGNTNPIDNTASIKKEDDAGERGVVFKKRKSKPIRQK